jgi:hypothetical protein
MNPAVRVNGLKPAGRIQRGYGDELIIRGAQAVEFCKEGAARPRSENPHVKPGLLTNRLFDLAAEQAMSGKRERCDHNGSDARQRSGRDCRERPINRFGSVAGQKKIPTPLPDRKRG